MTVMFFRTIIIYIILLAALRLMGKRQVGELQPSELVITFLLSEIASQPITDDNVPLLYGIVPIVVLLTLEVLASFAVTKVRFLQRIFVGTPSILIDKGVLKIKELKRVRVTSDELMSELRLKGIGSISQVYYAIMEENGKISVITTAPDTPASCTDLNLNVKEHGISRAIISDGKINDDALTALGKNRMWMNKRLNEAKLTPDEVFLMVCDDCSNYQIFAKENIK